MSKSEKTELIVNCVLGVLSIALAVFIFDYERYAMGQYSKILLQEERAGFGVAGILLMVFLYLPLEFCSGIFALFLFRLTWEMYRAEKKEQTDFIATQKAKAFKTKNRCLIALIVLKSVALAGVLWLVCIAFSSAYDTVLSKIVYCAALAVYAGSLVMTIVNRKKMKAQATNVLQNENNL